MLLLAIPLLIHLFQFHRTQTIYFPGVFRLIQRLQHARQQKKVQHWIVLLARMMAIACLVFAFAMPSCNSSKRNQEYSHVVVLFDNSYSMGTKNAGGVIIEQARSQAREMLTGLPPESQVRLFTQDPLVNSGWMSPAQAKSILDTIPLCPQQRQWSDWKVQVDELLQEGGISSLKVVAFGDGQLSVMASKPLLLSAPNVVWEYVLYPLDVNQGGGNLGIDTVWYESVWQNADAGANVLLKARIRNYSESSKETSLRMLGQGKTKHVKSLNLEAQGTAEVEFALSALEMTQASSLQLDEDGFGYDNQKNLHPIKQSQTVVGVLGYDDAVSAMFASQPLLKKVEFTRSDLLAGDKGVLSSTHALVLINDGVYSGQELSALRDFVASGKVVLQFFVDPIRRKNLNIGFGELRGEWLGGQAVKGGVMARRGATGGGDLQVDRLAVAGFQHPIFEKAFGESISEKTEMPWVGGHLKLESSLDFETVLQLESGDPILLKRVQDAGSYWIWLSDLRSGSQSLK
ncbi:MAG: BatA domain-containing protein, partial [Bacteroidota bacterium]